MEEPRLSKSSPFDARKRSLYLYYLFITGPVYVRLSWRTLTCDKLDPKTTVLSGR